MEKILSIIIPTYNMEKYLSKCLDSLICTSMNKLEVWIVNDGSKDSSLDIAAQYQKKYPEVFKIIDKPNGNYGSCINAALPKITGKFVKILDADDSFENANLEEFIQLLEKSEADLVINESLIHNEDGEITGKNSLPLLPAEKLLSFEETYSAIERKFPVMHLYTYKTEVFSELDYHQTEGISYTDNEWAYLPLVNVEKIYYWNKPLYRYLVGRAGQTMDPEILKKQFAQNYKIALWMAENYLRLKNRMNTFKKGLMEERVVILAASLYLDSLKKISDTQAEKDLQGFDDSLEKLDEDLYHKIIDKTKSKKLGINFIEYWKKHGRRHNAGILPFIRKVARLREKLK